MFKVIEKFITFEGSNTLCMLQDLNEFHIIYLDIETVGAYPNYFDMPASLRALWHKKAATLQYNKDTKAVKLFERAGIYAEFGKIVCISVGVVSATDKHLRIKSFYGHNEKALLSVFADMLNTHFNASKYLLCAHNGKEFDFPYIARRMLVQGLKLPLLLNTAGKKPWQVRHLDTLELWKFGDYKHYTSLELLTTIFDIPTPKDDIDGSQVNSVYWQEGNVERIARYCEKDVLAVAQLLRRYRGLPLFTEDRITFVESDMIV